MCFSFDINNIFYTSNMNEKIFISVIPFMHRVICLAIAVFSYVQYM